jgi:hypothetical protein
VSLEVAQNATPTVEIYAQASGAISSATVAIYGPDSDTALQSGSATVDSVSTTVATVASTNATQFTVSSATDIVAGRRYLLGLKEGAETVQVERLDGTTVYLRHPTAGVIRVGDTFTGLRVSYALTTATTATRKTNCHAAWVMTQSSGAVLYDRIEFHVVRSPLGQLVTVADVSRIAQSYGANLWATLRSKAHTVAEMATERVREAIEGHDHYPHLHVSRAAFARSGDAAIRLVLAEDYGISPQNAESPSAYLTEIRAQFAAAHGEAMRRLSWYDADDSGTVQTQERRGLQAVELRL